MLNHLNNDPYGTSLAFLMAESSATLMAEAWHWHKLGTSMVASAQPLLLGLARGCVCFTLGLYSSSQCANVQAAVS